jgi:transposase
MGRYGIGWLTAVAIWAEFGDVRRFANSRQAVRFCGLDITITESDGKRARGHLARKLAREAYHTLRELGDQALVPPSSQPPPEQGWHRARSGARIVAVVWPAP